MTNVGRKVVGLVFIMCLITVAGLQQVNPVDTLEFPERTYFGKQSKYYPEANVFCAGEL